MTEAAKPAAPSPAPGRPKPGVPPVGEARSASGESTLEAPWLTCSIRPACATMPRISPRSDVVKLVVA